MRARYLLYTVLASSLAHPRAAVGQTSTERAVRAVVDSFFAAVMREKWDSAASFVDLTRFERHFKQVVGNARTALPSPPMTVESMMAADTTMPRAVAEWEVERMKRYKMPAFGDMSHEFAGVRTQRDLFALTVPEAAARWLEAKDERTAMREAFRRSGCALDQLPTLPAVNRSVLAVAVANDSTVYVIHTDDRFHTDDLNGPKAERVMSVRRLNGRWRIEARDDLLRPFNMGYSYGMSCPKPKQERQRE